MGGLSISVDGTRVDDQIPEKAALIIAYLADGDAPARRSRLAGLLWSDASEDRARGNLRVALTRLRAALGELVAADRERVWLTTQAEYDAAHVASGNSDAIIECYSGDFLEGVDLPDAMVFMDWVDARRASLRTTAMLSLSEDLERARRTRDWDYGAGLAVRIVELEPWNEPAHRFLMTSAAARGDRSGALAQYGRCVDALESSLGLEPDDETRSLADSLRDGISETSVDAPPPQLAPEIPFDMTPFLGRENEVARLVDRANGAYRLVTIFGPGGVGKTRLAAEVARKQDEVVPGSVVWATLTSISTAQEFAAALSDLLVPDAVFSQADPLAQLIAAVGGRRLWLVLDNFEQLVDTTSELLLELLRSCPRVTAILTSRRLLDVAAEDVFALAGLPTPGDDDDIGQSASVRLFVDRAYRSNKTFSLNEQNQHDVAELCTLLEGVPLHLELAAARLSLLTVRELIEHIRHNASLPGEAPRDAPDRHRTFDAIFEQSWGLLDAEAQVALAKLSLTRGGFDREAAVNLLASDGSEPIRLARMSLLTEERGGRFRFHELVRQSAEARLSVETRTEAEVAHAHWYLGRLEDAQDSLLSSEALAASKPLLHDVENIRQAWGAAIEHGLTELLASAADGLSHLFEMAGRAIETEALMADAAAACAKGVLPSNDSADEAFFVRIQARQRAAWSMDDATATLCLRVAELLEDRPDRARDLAWSQLHHAQAIYHHGEVADALRLLETSESTAGNAIDDAGLRAWSLALRGRILSATGQFDEAAEVFREAIELFVAIDNQRGHAQTLSYLAVTYAEQNRVWDAYVADRAALELCAATGNRQLLSGRHENLAASYLLLGDYESARNHTAEALAIYRRNAEWDMESYALAQHGECLLGLGDVDAGEEAMSTGIAMMRDEEFAFGLMYNLPPWIRHLQRCGRDAQALLAIEELVDIGLDRGAEHFVLTGRALLARSQARVDQRVAALVLAEEVWAMLQGPNPPRLPWTVATLLDLASVFEQADDSRFADVLAAAHETQRHTAKSIADPTLRRLYMEQHAASVELAAMTSRLEG